MAKQVGVTPYIPPGADKETRAAFDRVWARLKQFEGDLDLSGRRVVNAGRPVQGGDYVTLDVLKEELGKIHPGGMPSTPAASSIATYSFAVSAFTINATYTLGWIFVVSGAALNDFILVGHDKIYTLMPGCVNSLELQGWVISPGLIQVSLHNFNSSTAFNIPDGHFHIGLLKG